MRHTVDALELFWMLLSLPGAVRAVHGLRLALGDVRAHRDGGVNGPVAAAANVAKWRLGMMLFLLACMFLAGLVSGLRPPSPGPRAYDASRVAVIVLLFLVDGGAWAAVELELLGRRRIKEAWRHELVERGRRK